MLVQVYRRNRKKEKLMLTNDMFNYDNSLVKFSKEITNLVYFNVFELFSNYLQLQNKTRI